MSISVPQPTFGRVASILWFPFFLAVAMSALFVAPLAHPTPHDMRIGVVGGAEDVAALQTRLDDVQPGGFAVGAIDAAAAIETVRQGDVAAALTSGPEPRLLVASSAGATRTEFLEATLPPVVQAPVLDVAPSAVGDATGTGVFFYALPIAVVSMVSAIVLLQLGAWSYRRKMAAVTAIAAFTAGATWSIAVWQQVVPSTGRSALLMLGTFVLVQAIGWTLTGAAEFVRQFLVPIALTFVLVLGVPTAGAPVSADMLPRALGALHAVMPVAQFVGLVRALAYGAGSPLCPAIVLLAWLTLGAALIAMAERRRARLHTAAPSPVASTSATHELWGTVTSQTGLAVVGAVVRVVDADGSGTLQTRTTTTGAYRLFGVREGLHHVLVAAAEAQPEIVSVVVRHGGVGPHNFSLQRWVDPDVDLPVGAVGASSEEGPHVPAR